MLKEVTKEEVSQAELQGILLNLNNGDLAAVEAAKKKWKFKTRVDVIRYALAVIAQSELPILYINQGGEKIGLTPNENLLEKEGASSTGE